MKKFEGLNSSRADHQWVQRLDPETKTKLAQLQQEASFYLHAWVEQAITAEIFDDLEMVAIGFINSNELGGERQLVVRQGKISLMTPRQFDQQRSAGAQDGEPTHTKNHPEYTLAQIGVGDQKPEI